MIINIDSPINKYYVQTLCMIFFPGEKFGEHEEDSADTPSLELRTEYREEGVFAYAEMKLGDKVCKAEKLTEYSDHRSKERTLKIAVGAAILAAAGELKSYRPSWGMLVGVRPSKVATEMLNSGMSKTRVKKILASDYLVIPKKATLAVDVALNEKRISGAVEEKDCSVYISIPFCPTRCTYCSFVSYTSQRLLDLIPAYLEKLLVDLETNFKVISELGLNVKTIYIGGGTPTILTAEQLRRLLSKINSLTDVSKLLEFTLEAGRPDTITAEKFAVAKEYGVTRVSVNPQTLCDEVLCAIGRTHTAEDFFRAFDIARNSQIKTINVDLIAGLPGDTFKNFSATYDNILQLAPENITVHTFCVKKASDILRRNSQIYSINGGTAGKCVD